MRNTTLCQKVCWVMGNITRTERKILNDCCVILLYWVYFHDKYMMFLLLCDNCDCERCLCLGPSSFLKVGDQRRLHQSPPSSSVLRCPNTVCNWLIPPFLNVFCPTSLRSTTVSLAIDTSIQDEVGQTTCSCNVSRIFQFPALYFSQKTSFQLQFFQNRSTYFILLLTSSYSCFYHWLCNARSADFLYYWAL